MINEEIIDTMLRMATDAKQRGFLTSDKNLEGACVLTSDGTLYSATNLENSTGEVDFCAPMVVLSKAIADGKLDFDALALVRETDDITSVCEECHYIINRFKIPDIILGNTKGEMNAVSAEDLVVAEHEH